MKKIATMIVLGLVVLLNTSHSQQIDTLLRGVYLFDFDNVNFVQMRDSLHLNAFQIRTGLHNTQWEIDAMNNPAGLKLVNQRQFLRNMSTAQRMVYQPEFNPPPKPLLWNYFATKHEDLSPAELDTSRVLFAPGVAGYMVKDARPNNEYHYLNYPIYQRWYAMFRLRVEGTHAASETVATCIVWCLERDSVLAQRILTYGDFSPPTSYHDFTLQFFLLPHFPSAPGAGAAGSFLSGGFVDRHSASRCDSVDLRVYWHGGVTTYLDKIVVEDSVAHTRLFNHSNDFVIKEQAATYGNLPLHYRFYLEDEPPISTYLAFNYVGNRIKDTLGWNTLRAKSVTATYKDFERFLIDASPGALMVDPYFITSDIPHPSIATNNPDTLSGIEPWNYATYVERLQFRIDEYLQSTIRPAAESASQDTLIFIPQLHGVAFKGTSVKYRTPNGSLSLRPPSPSELRLQYNLGIAYGAKGFLAYPYGTDYLPEGFDVHNYPAAFPGVVSRRMNSSGFRMDHSADIDTVYDTYIWTGYKEKWDELSVFRFS